jgi:hypothetical protein
MPVQWTKRHASAWFRRGTLWCRRITRRRRERHTLLQRLDAGPLHLAENKHPRQVDRHHPDAFPRRFPPPWSIEGRQESFIVKDANGQCLAYLYFERNVCCNVVAVGDLGELLTSLLRGFR